MTITNADVKQTITSVPLIKADLPSVEFLEDSLREILLTGRVSNFGKHVTRFEAECSTYLGADACAISSGTMGLLFVLQALGLQRGQKVILPSFTFVATAQAVLYAGGVPVFADVLDDLTLDPVDLEALFERHENVGAVIGVHTYGMPCRTDDIQQVVERAKRRANRSIALVYDAAHAFGAAIDDRRVGSFGDAEVFSLSVTKALVSVEGGMVSSSNPEVTQRIRKMRNYGIEASYDAHYPGMNGKMSEFHALVGLYNLERLEGYVAMRQQMARYYINRLGATTSFDTLPWRSGVRHTFKDFTVLTSSRLSGRRDDVIAYLKHCGIETRAYFYPPVHEQKFFARFADRRLPKTEDLARRVITLPFYTSIAPEEVDYVVDALVSAEARLT